MLLDAGADTSLSSAKDGDTALIISSSEGYVKVVTRLIQAGADVNIFNANGWTPLIYAAYYGHNAVIKLLIEYSAAINQTSKVCVV